MENKLIEHEPPTIEVEEHEIIYRHYYVDNKGNRHPLEQPIVCRQVTLLGDQYSQPWLINEMIDKLKHFMLQQIGKPIKLEIGDSYTDE